MTTIPAAGVVSPTSGVNLADMLPYVDVDQLVEQVNTLHRGAEGAVCLMRRNADRPMSATPHVWGEMVPDGDPQGIFDDTMRHAWRNCLVHGSARWDMYVALATFDKPTGRGKDGKLLTYSRQARYVREVAGFFADLDVKPGVGGEFQSRVELDAFLNRMPPTTMLVDTGSGGAHAYWLTQSRLTGKRIVPQLLNSWHDFMQERAGEVILDHVSEPSRVLRMAGTVRWSKPDEVVQGWPAFTRVELRHSDGPRYPIQELASLAKDAHTRAEECRSAARAEFNHERQETLALLQSRGLILETRDLIEQKFNTQQDWGVLLKRAGWVLVKDGRDGSGHSRDCRAWRRPGLADTAHISSSTDWGDSNLMTIYTNDSAIVELADLNISSGRFRHTTKYRFALIALYAGDEASLILDVRKNGGMLP